MKVFCWFNSYPDALIEARLPTEEEKRHRSAWYQEHLIYATEPGIRLKYVSFADVPSGWWKERKCWTFISCSNQAVEISDEEWNSILALENQRAKEAAEKERQDEIQRTRDLIARAESRNPIPTPEEAQRIRQWWKDVNNEGGDGYVPHIVDTEGYEWAKKRLAELLAQEQSKIE